MIIQHNLFALNAQRQLNITGNKKQKGMEKLSSGYRINRAADDAAGLAISEKMRRQIRGLHQGAENIQEGINYVQVAEGALNEVHDMLQRINELAVKSANGTYTPTERQYMDDEVQHLKKEMERIFETTAFNEQRIWRDNTSVTPPTQVQVGVESKQAVTMNCKNERIFITNANSDVLAYDKYTINADVSGINVSWLGYDGNNYQTETIDWDTLKANNYSFDMSNYFGANDGTNKLYDTNGTPAFSREISFTPHENATVDDMIASLNGITMASSPYFDLSFRYDGVPAASSGTEVAPGVKVFGFGSSSYGAFYASNMDFDNPDDAFMEPTDSSGTVVTAGGNTGNLTSVPSAITTGDINAAKTSTDIWEFSFDLKGIGKVTATSDRIEYAANGGGGGLATDYGMGTLGSVMSTLYPSSFGLPGLLSPANGGDSDNGGYIRIIFTTSSEQTYAYANQTSNHIMSFGIDISVYNTDTEQDVFNRLTSALNGTTVMDLFKENGSSDYFYTGAPVAKTHMIDVPIYSSTGGSTTATTASLIIQAGPESDDDFEIVYDSLSNAYLGMDTCNVLTQDACGDAIDSVRGAINLVSKQRADFGAYQNRMEHAYNSNKNVEENTQHSESRIRDTDMASAMVEYSNLNILQQAGQSMLAQANTSKDGVITLLQGQ